MGDWILFLVGLAIFLAFSAVLYTVFLGAFTARMKRYLLGRIIGRALKGTRADHDLSHRTLEVFGLDTRSGGSADRGLERLRPKAWQETIAWVCYCGIALGFALMVYAIARQ